MGMGPDEGISLGQINYQRAPMSTRNASLVTEILAVTDMSDCPKLLVSPLRSLDYGSSGPGVLGLFGMGALGQGVGPETHGSLHGNLALPRKNHVALTRGSPQRCLMLDFLPPLSQERPVMEGPL